MVYPNPANNQLTIISEKLSINSISVTDVQGKIVAGLTKNFSPRQASILNCTLATSIDISSITPGIYFINIKTEDQIIFTIKFIKL